jgi:hypothetical protein
LVLAAAAALAVALPARAALVLEFIQVASTTEGPSSGPALTGTLTLNPGDVVFLQVALRDTLGSGPNVGQPGTVPWQTNGGLAGPGSVGLGAFFIRFDGLPGVAVNPSPTIATNARLVNPIDYGTVTAGTSPPTFTRIGGLLNFGSEPGAVPDPANQNRIALFNLRVQAIGQGSGVFRLRDPNPAPTSVDNAILSDSDLGGSPNAGTISGIDDLLFGASFTNTYDLPIVVTPEPTSLAFAGLALAGLGVRKFRRKTRA